jgi:cyclophilin family peptidyl-prolyl cis-trans isomerase
MSEVVLQTKLGSIVLKLRPDVAPVSVAHFVALVKSGAMSAASFYRSDFVIQFGLHGSKVASPLPDLKVNETKLSNLRGSVAIAHWDVPDCGNSEFFISLRANPHLDNAFGGFAVFAQVNDADVDSLATMDKIGAAIAKKDPAVLKIEKIELK